VTSSALSAAVAEIDFAIQMKWASAECRARGVGLRVTAGTGAWEVAGRWRTVAVSASDRGRRFRPNDPRLRAALVVAVDGAGAAGGIVARLSRNHGRIE
jgi:hypothetical protein